MQRLQAIGVSVGLVLASAGSGRLATAQGGSARPSAAQARPLAADPVRTQALLGRLHRAAEREIQLGELAESAAARPETRVYGAELKAQFRSFDDRLKAFATANGVSSAELASLAPGENVVAMQRHVESLAQLANTRGEAFERGFWVAIATEQAATTDALAATVDQDPALAGIASDMSELLDRSSRRAAAAAEAAGLASAPASAAPAAPTPAAPVAPSDTEETH